MSKTFLSIASGPGIALATAGRFGREGYRVVLAARNIARLQADAGRQRAGRLRHGLCNLATHSRTRTRECRTSCASDCSQWETTAQRCVNWETARV